VKDAAQDSKQRGAIASRPAAAAGNKNWIWIDSTTGQMSYSTGSAWVDIGQPKNQAQVATTLTPTVRQFGGTATSTFRAWGGAAGSRRLIAQKITVGSAGAYTLHRVKFELQRLGATAGTIQCDIRADSSGVPGTTLATAQTKFLAPDLADGPSGLTNGDFIFNGLALANSTSYWIVLRVQNIAGSGDALGVRQSDATSGVAEFNGTTWTTQALGLVFTTYTGVTDFAVVGDNQGPVVGTGFGGIRGDTAGGPAVVGAGQVGVQGTGRGAAGVQGIGGRGPGVEGRIGGTAPGVRSRLDGGSGDLFQGADADGNPNFRIDSAGMMAQAAKGSVRNSYFHDAFRSVVSGVDHVDITGLTAFTAIKEYDLTIAGAVAAGGVNRAFYLQPNYPSFNGGKHVVRRDYTSGGAPAGDWSGSSLTGVDPNGCFIGSTDWNTDCEVFMFVRITLDGWTRYLYWESIYYNTSAANTDNMLMGRISGIWYPASTPLTEVSNFRIGLTGGTFNGAIRLRGYGT
jgi:hypothetical protein